MIGIVDPRGPKAVRTLALAARPALHELRRGGLLCNAPPVAHAHPHLDSTHTHQHFCATAGHEYPNSAHGHKHSRAWGQ